MNVQLALPRTLAFALLLTPTLTALPTQGGFELVQVEQLGFPQANALFGDALDREGGILAVGVPHSESGFPGQEVGQVQVFFEQSGEWELTQDLIPVHAYNIGHFGQALDLDGDTLAVGAPGESVPGFQGTGHVYIYRNQGGTFTLEETLQPPVLEAYEDFGRELSLDGDVLVVQGSTDYVFDRVGSSWALRSEVGDPFSGSQTAPFASGDHVLLGKSGGCAVCTGAKVYTWTGTQYQQTAFVQAPDAGERFMRSVAVRGNTFVVGSPGANSSPPPLADSYVYELTGTTWNLVGELEDPTAFDSAFGGSVAFDGRWAVVGAPTGQISSSNDSSLTVFDRDDSWGLTTRIQNPGSETFATSLHMEDGQLLVGDPGLNRVVCYVMEQHPGTVVCSPAGAPCACFNSSGDTTQGCLNSTGEGAELIAVGSPSVATNQLGLRASNLPAGSFAVLFSGDALLGTPGTLLGDGYRCVDGNLTRLSVASADRSGEATWNPATALWQAGDTAYMQVWYRDAASLCGTFFNLSATIAVTLEP